MMVAAATRSFLLCLVFGTAALACALATSDDALVTRAVNINRHTVLPTRSLKEKHGGDQQRRGGDQPLKQRGPLKQRDEVEQKAGDGGEEDAAERHWIFTHAVLMSLAWVGLLPRES